MNPVIKKPFIPLPPSVRINNHIQTKHINSSREKQRSRRKSKNGVTLYRQHSIRFDKQYQQKHLLSKGGLTITSPNKQIPFAKQLQQTTVNDQSTMIQNSKTYNTILDQTSLLNGTISSNRYMSQQNLTPVKNTYKNNKEDDVKSVTSLDQRNNYQKKVQVKGK